MLAGDRTLGEILFCQKRAEYGAFFPQKIVLDMIIPNRNNSKIILLNVKPVNHCNATIAEISHSYQYLQRIFQ